MGLYNRNQDILDDILEDLLNEDFAYDPEHDWSYPSQIWDAILDEEQDDWDSEEEVNFLPIHPLPQVDPSGWDQHVVPPEGPSGWEIPPDELHVAIPDGFQTPPPRTPPSSPPPAPKKRRKT